MISSNREVITQNKKTIEESFFLREAIILLSLKLHCFTDALNAIREERYDKAEKETKTQIFTAEERTS